jgi:hypothetical protein
MRPNRENTDRNTARDRAARFLLFVSGLVMGGLAGRAARPQPGGNRDDVCSAPTGIAIQPTIAREYPQATTFSEVSGHEHSDIHLLAILMIIFVVGVGAFVIHAALWSWVSSKGPSTMEETASSQLLRRYMGEQERDYPKLQLSPARDLREFRIQEDQRLHGLSTGAGSTTNSMPIGRAVEVLVDHGFSGAAGRDRQSPVQLQQRRAIEPRKETP